MQEPALNNGDNRTSKETFRRRLSYYMTGFLIGFLLLMLLLYAKWSLRQKQAAGPGEGVSERGAAVEGEREQGAP